MLKMFQLNLNKDEDLGCFLKNNLYSPVSGEINKTAERDFFIIIFELIQFSKLPFNKARFA